MTSEQVINEFEKDSGVVMRIKKREETEEIKNSPKNHLLGNSFTNNFFCFERKKGFNFVGSLLMIISYLV